MDLSVALNCIRVQREYGTYRGAKIGVIKHSDTFSYRNGQVVLFTDEKSPTDYEMMMGEYRGVEQKVRNTVTIESPMTQEEIEKQRANKSLLTTLVPCVNFPRAYLEEITL